jgi:tetratricopeptide (TPR) repeat protein
MKLPIIIPFILLATISQLSYGQMQVELFQRGLACKKANNINEGLLCFQKLLKSDSSNLIYLTSASIFYSKKGNEIKKEKSRQTYFNIAFYLAKKALALVPQNAESNYCMALAMGRMNEFASNKTKIANSKSIKKYIDASLALNPAHAGAYHLLGRWNRTIAKFGPLDKMMINKLYGGMPKGATLTGALNAFIKAVALEPNYKLHQFELAQTYLDMGKKVQALYWLKHCLSIKAVNETDAKIDGMCKKLMAKSSQH